MCLQWFREQAHKKEHGHIEKRTNLVTEGRSATAAALAAVGITELASNTEEARLDSTLRRSKSGLFTEFSCVFTDEDFGAIGEIVENDETVVPSIEENTAIVSSERTFIVGWRRELSVVAIDCCSGAE